MSADPRATYRLQFTPEFTFDAAAAVADYLAALGVSHLYASPYLQAAPGSTHGYDVVDHHRANGELGGEEGHARLCAALRRAGLGQVLDIVPNHMAIGTPENGWWWDVLENGPSSVYASYFDVDWDPPESKLRNTVLLPVLGDHYGRVLEAGELALRREGGSFTVHYYDNLWPVAPRSLDTLLATAAERCESDELESIAAALGRLPHAASTDPDSVRERHRDKEVLRSRLAQLCEEQPEVAAAVDVVVAEANGDPDALDALLDRQNYRLAFWRTAGRELDYRRFFDINTLIGLRIEDPDVFADTHQRILEWVHEGVVDGLRIDHPDGLRDPSGYLDRLAEATGGVWVVVEKILEHGERLPSAWATAGTTGYDFLNLLGGLFVDPAGERALTGLYEELTGQPTDWPGIVVDKKLLVLRDVLAADVIRLTNLLVAVCERHRRYRDYTRNELHDVLREVAASFPVYRTYVPPAGDDDRRFIETAAADVARRRPDIDADLLDFVRRLLLGEMDGEAERELVARFQQLTGPVMAKGVEDTAFYTYNRLVSLNEVGGDPGHFGTSVEEFHAACTEAQRQWPAAMLATSTHDTKRSEDVRSRISLLSEIPDEWAGFAVRWVKDGPVDANAQYLLLQVLVGAWPLDPDRAVAYMEKASKEAKEHTSWIDPDPAYDEALTRHVRELLADERFQGELAAFVAPLVEIGRVTSLAQTLIKLTAPGVPDIYQGQELWDLSLVDPDNRRPVDYEQRRRLLAELDDLKVDEVIGRSDDGLPKLLVVKEALALRARRPDAFGRQSTYRPLPVGGDKAEHAVAFARGDEAVTVAPRLVLRLDGQWAETAVELPDGRWTNVFTGEEHSGGPVELADLLRSFPVALLEHVPST
ncbi:MAG TPA: malto-oligosyltrehalose synthase [Acidimicrobiales bacterium]|nr:malto-oligosyltrehalose synthase [Acidimicrobiales bacterium]